MAQTIKAKMIAQLVCPECDSPLSMNIKYQYLCINFKCGQYRVLYESPTVVLEKVES